MHKVFKDGNEIRLCSCKNNHKYGYWRVSLCYGQKHKINAIKIQNGRKECVKILES